MTITEVSPEEYNGLFATSSHVYNSCAFCELNRHKAKAVHYLVFADSKARFGLVLGERADGFYSPFSAPFGGFVMPKEQLLNLMEEAVSLLKEYGNGTRQPIHITLPPLIYDCSQLSKWANTLNRLGTMQSLDLNYHFNLSLFPHYEKLIKSNARNKLRNFMSQEMEFLKMDSHKERDIERAYRVISANRQEHGYPLRMSLQDVIDTTKIVNADFFVMSHNGTDIAAAQVFHVANGIAQVIYWGDLADYSNLRTMNGLAYHIFSHYHQCGLRILDIGPSTENGTPNLGLCEFKESVGCSVSPKFSFVL